MGFITELSRQTDERFQTTLAKFGQFYINSLIQVIIEIINYFLNQQKGITGNAGRQLLDYIGDGLFFISKPNVQHFAAWLQHWLQERRQVPGCKESDIQRANFVQQLIR